MGEKNVGDYYICHHIEVDDISNRTDVERNPIYDVNGNPTHVGHKDSHVVGIKSKEPPRHIYECPDCGKRRSVCPVCKSEGFFINEDGGRVYCHNCSPSAARKQIERSRRER